MYKYIFFDLDGTLTDPGIGITNSVAYALDKYNIKVEDKKKLNIFIGPPLQDSFKMFYGFDDEKAMEAVEYYREYFKDKGLYENEVYPNIYELLEELKRRNKKLVVATSKPEVFTHKILDYFNLSKYFDFVAGATLDGSRSKKADIIRYAIEGLNIENKNDVIMIGDRKHDIIGANQNNIDSIGVLYGYGSIEELKDAKATYIAKEVLDILNYL